MEIDVQDMKPETATRIDKVGVRSLPVLASVENKAYRIANIRVGAYVNLSANRKGIHASRLVNSILSLNENRLRFKSLEGICKEVSDSLEAAIAPSRLEVVAAGDLFIRRITPVSRKASIEQYGVSIRVVKKQKRTVSRIIGVKVVGNCLCPCMLIRIGKSHIQRAEIETELEADVNSRVSLGSLISASESAFSAPTFGLVKIEDEEFIVEKMFKNPRFVEDLVRSCLSALIKKRIRGKVLIKATAYESIHKHDLSAEIERRLR